MHWLIPQMITIGGTEQNRSKEPGASSGPPTRCRCPRTWLVLRCLSRPQAQSGTERGASGYNAGTTGRSLVFYTMKLASRLQIFEVLENESLTVPKVPFIFNKMPHRNLELDFSL